MSEFAARLTLYGLTSERLERAVRLAPQRAAVVDQAVDAYVEAAGQMPNVGAIFVRHCREIRSRLRIHFDGLVSGGLDASYAARAADLARWETQIGPDARARAMAGNMRLCACLSALAQNSPLGSRAVAEQGASVSQLLAFDLASTITAHHDAAQANARGRYGGLTRDLGAFGTSDTSYGLAKAMLEQTHDAQQIAHAARDASDSTRRAHHEAESIASSASRGVSMADDLASWTTKLTATADTPSRTVDAFARSLRRA